VSRDAVHCGGQKRLAERRLRGRIPLRAHRWTTPSDRPSMVLSSVLARKAYTRSRSCAAADHRPELLVAAMTAEEGDIGSLL